MDGGRGKRSVGRGRGGRMRIKSDTRDSEPSPTRGSGSDSISFPHTSSSPSTALESLNLGESETSQSPEFKAEHSEEKEPVSFRGAIRGYRYKYGCSYVESRPGNLETKQGKVGQVVPLLTNYFILKKPCQWALYEHSAVFEPEQDNTIAKKAMIRKHKDVIGAYMFYGGILFTNKEIMEQDTLTLFSTGKDGIKYTITIKRVGKLLPDDLMYMQFYNFIVRKCLFGIGLDEVGRNFFDHKSTIEIKGRNLVLWTGFVTTMRLHEEELMLCVDVTHKVLRQDSVLVLMNKIRDNNSRGDKRQLINAEILGGIIITHYNRNKTYRVHDILYDLNPMSKFDMNGTPTTYADYYKTKYQVEIKNLVQPMLVASIWKKDIHLEWNERGPRSPCYLIPELCHTTGLTHEMRADFPLMNDLKKHLRMIPQNRAIAINQFMERLLTVQPLKNKLKTWGFEFNTEMVKCNGRILPRENIVFATSPRNPDPEKTNEKADWTMAFRSRQLLKTIALERWVIIVPKREAQNTDNWIKIMIQAAKPLNFNISRPLEVLKLANNRSDSYQQAIDISTWKYENIQLVFVVLPSNKLELYAAVKKRLSVDIGVLSQCFLAENFTKKGELMSIATKVAIQITAKLGGQPWSIELPLKNAMMIGFDVHRCAEGSWNRKDIGAMVSTTSANYASYYSTISYSDIPFSDSQHEISRNLVRDTTKCIHAYQKVNGLLPERIFFFRDGVGDGQVSHVFDTELKDINTAIKNTYDEGGNAHPKLTYIIVTRKINTRFFDVSVRPDKRPDNPIPGTVVDNTITLPERYDFYLVAQAARQGTVSPCNYHVLQDDQALGPDKLQRIAYKMCHMYFNWSGTVAVPAPCQYAHKLAFLAGTALDARPSAHLSNLLHFL